MNPYRPPLGRSGQDPPPRKDSLPPRPPPSILQRTTSASSLASSDETPPLTRPQNYVPGNPYGGQHGTAITSTSTLTTANIRPPPRRVSQESGRASVSPIMPQIADINRHRRQHSQGFFEPSLPTASHIHAPTLGSNLTTSTIAAQAAMHNQNGTHIRRLSQNMQDNSGNNLTVGRRKASGPITGPASTASTSSSRASSQTRPTLQINSGSSSTAATAAANVVFPRSPAHSPVFPQGEVLQSPTTLEKEQKPAKEKSRMKIFSKPKSSLASSNKDSEKKTVTIASPKKTSIYPSQTFPRSANQSAVSLADSINSGVSSLYTLGNQSSTTIMQSDRSTIGGEKEKHRHHFLSRQRNKLKEVQDHYSSASSNSRPVDPAGPAPLYSFAPSSPGPTATFSKSKTGLDLRHGGRALREKKREEKAAAGTFVAPLAMAAAVAEQRDASLEFGVPSVASTFGPSSMGPQTSEILASLNTFGMPGMTLDDAWPFLRAHLLNIFGGEDIRTPIEDLNKLVMAHLQRCVNIQMPNLIIDDLRELLETGYYSINQTLRRVPDDKLVLHLVDTWSLVFGVVLPFIQAVFHPLDLEFKGRGALLTSKDARDFWGALPLGPTTKVSAPLTTTTNTSRGQLKLASLGDVLDVRTLVLLTFRDTIILPRYETLLSIFSRLSLDSINTTSVELPKSPQPIRPDTAASSSSGAGYNDTVSASFNSQGSTLLDSSNSGSLGARSRATSNVSALSSGSFHSVPSQRTHDGSSNPATPTRGIGPFVRPPIMASASAAHTAATGSTQVTQTAARMLQCVSVLAGLQAASSLFGDNATIRERADEEQDAELVARRKMENLGKALKLNWLGRSRTGRNRRGLVGTRTVPAAVDVGA